MAVALLGISLMVACHGPPPSARPIAGDPVAPAASTSAPGPPPRSTVPAAEVAEAVEPPELPAGTLTAWKPSATDPPEIAALKTLILHGDVSSRTIKALQKFTHKYPQDEELPYLLGQLYFNKLWVGDGLKAFRSAIQLNPQYRENPFLLRAVITGLGNDSDHGQVRRFLLQDVGRPAAPYLEEILYGDWRAQVKERAAAVLRELP